MAIGGKGLKTKIDSIVKNTTTVKNRFAGDLQDKPAIEKDRSIARWLTIILKLLTVIDIIIRLIENIIQL
jgi:hypothetical protein